MLARIRHYSFEILTATLFGMGLLIQTLGRVPGGLRPLAIALAIPFLIAMVLAIVEFGLLIRTQLGKGWARLYFGVLLVQVFWALVRAPLDVDGIFYHLTIVLDALQKNQWGTWQFQIWQVQSTPKVSEVFNLSLIALGGFRLAQLGHFATAILGAWAFADAAKSLGLKRPALFGLIYWLTPIVNKQMTSNYVDMAFYSFWLACAAFALRLVVRLDRRDLWLLGMSAFLLVGCKMNGFVSLAAIAPILFLARNQWKQATLVCTGFTILSSAFWMIPNALAWGGNPVFPIQPAALWSGGALKLVPNEIPITGLNGWLGGVVAPDSIRWFLQFLIFEPVAQYDMCGGAWGFVGVWALVMAVWVVLFRREWITLPRINLIWAFYLALLLSFLLTPGRVTARYAILSGFLVIFPILVLWINDRLPRWSSRLLFLAIALQIPYITIERVLFRGVQASEIARAPQVIAENFRDILVHGEPQSPERWMHFDYVPSLRKNEPRDVVVGQDCVSLTALYWGRTFSNHVTVAPECCRWPYDCSQVGGGSPL